MLLNCKIVIRTLLSVCLYIVIVTDIATSEENVITKSSNKRICSSYTNCGLCISSPSCAWCSSKNYTLGVSKCDAEDSLKLNGCPHNEIVNPASSVEIIQNDMLKISYIILWDFTNVNSVLSLKSCYPHAVPLCRDQNNIPVKMNESPIQMHPQRVHHHIRLNDIQRFTITYEQALDYPIDLYYLMDLTNSMKDHKDMVALLAHNLAESMKNMSHNFRLGFGSFIDKVVMPYANMIPKRLENPCIDSTQCSSPYGFRNHLPLNNNISRFTEEVTSAPLSANLDNAEGGFDAIMQVIVCRDHIKWNDLSRKIILFATDSIFHYAGDGKLGGIVKPNDGQCHLDAKGYYSESILQDYPSLSQIHRVVSDSKINIIFAVPEESIGVYRQLSEHIPGSTTGKLESDSSNIVEIIKENFAKITSKIELTDNSSSSVEMRYMSNCLRDHKRETNQCESIGIGKSVTFDVELKVTKCPPNGRETFVISPIGVGEYTVVDLHVICECDCEMPPVAVVNATECNYHGVSACGVCECDQNRFGRECECNGNDAIRQDKIDLCKRDKSTSVLCTNRGDCVCGECQCRQNENLNEKIFGEYCECDTFSCQRGSNGLVCSGTDRGRCCDGECLCLSDWNGPSCGCTTRNETCVNPVQSKKLCSGHGNCRCGRCECTDQYYGEFCQDCASCEGRCNELHPCVECKIFMSGNYTQIECRDKCTFRYRIVKELEYIDNDRHCIIVDHDGCSISFNYNYDDQNDLFVRVLEERQCPSKQNAIAIIGSISGAIVLIGLMALLIWRIIVYKKDKEEYAKFTKEVEATKFEQNVNDLYKSPKTHHPNPVYNPKSN